MVHVSSNVKEVIRAILNFFFFFYEKILHAQLAQKAYKQTKIKKAAFYALKKHLKGKKSLISLICIFVLLFLIIVR